MQALSLSEYKNLNPFQIICYKLQFQRKLLPHESKQNINKM